MGIKKTVCLLQFQFTPLREGLLEQFFIYYSFMQFQFTPLREGLLGIGVGFEKNIPFQFTPLREGLLLFSVLFFQPFIYFNSRPCERGFREW